MSTRELLFFHIREATAAHVLPDFRVPLQKAAAALSLSLIGEDQPTQDNVNEILDRTKDLTVVAVRASCKYKSLNKGKPAEALLSLLMDNGPHQELLAIKYKLLKDEPISNVRAVVQKNQSLSASHKLIFHLGLNAHRMRTGVDACVFSPSKKGLDEITRHGVGVMKVFDSRWSDRHPANKLPGLSSGRRGDLLAFQDL